MRDSSSLESQKNKVDFSPLSVLTVSQFKERLRARFVSELTEEELDAFKEATVVAFAEMPRPDRTELYKDDFRAPVSARVEKTPSDEKLSSNQADVLDRGTAYDDRPSQPVTGGA